MEDKDKVKDKTNPQKITDRGRLHQILETPPGFWLSRGIGIIFVILSIVFFLAWFISLPGYGGHSFVEILLSPS